MPGSAVSPGPGPGACFSVFLSNVYIYITLYKDIALYYTYIYIFYHVFL